MGTKEVLKDDYTYLTLHNPLIKVAKNNSKPNLPTPFQITLLEILKRRTMRDAQLGEESIRVATEALGQIRTVQGLCRQNYFHQEFCKATVKPFRRSLWSAPLQVSSSFRIKVSPPIFRPPFLDLEVVVKR